MPFNKDKNISQGKPDGRKKNPGAKAGIGGQVGHGKATRFTSENNPQSKKTGFRGTPMNGSHGLGEKTRFQKGNVPKNKLLRTILKEKGFTRETINEIFADLLTANPKLLQEMKVDDNISMLELIGISGIETAMRTADFGRMDYLLGQIFGKPVQRTETVNYNMNAALNPTSEEDAEIMKRILERAGGSFKD